MAGPHRFGRFEIRPVERQLLIEGRMTALGARAFDLLLALIERHDRVVSKNELLDVVWPGLVVEENNLQVQVSALRKLLGPQAIATIPGRGYRFTLMGESQTAAAAAAGSTAAAAASVSNLPASLPPLYGRAADIAQVRALLADNPVVSIVGAGGIGKTRLALAVASELRDQFSDGAWWVELAPLSSAEFVDTEVARVLRVPLAPDRTAVDAIANVLRTQSLLLLLDNCEHLLDAVATLVDSVSRTAPKVRILVTSQEPLKTADERVYRLGTLGVPSLPGLDAAASSGAVQLFIGRARSVDSHFELTAANADAVVEICRRLDGIALALDLAAARLPLLGIDGLRARLDERFHILTGGSRFVLRRHQTLRAALDFSHSLLSPDEQAVFRRCGVFAGSFAVESAQEVAADERIDAWAVLDHLGALVDKSMIAAESGSHPRLRLLESTRAYALEKLADAGETNRTIERHARAMTRLFAQMYEAFWHLSDDAWLGRHAPELDNLRAAVDWGLRNDAEVAIQLVGDSRPLWLELALQPEAVRYCEAALAQISVATPPRAAGRLWHALAAMVANARPAQSRDAAARAIELLRGAGDPGTLAAALMALTFWSKALPTKQQLDALDELTRLSDARWPPRMRMTLPNARAWIHRAAGRHAEARREYALTRDLAARCGATQWELASQDNVADMALIMGDYDTALAIYREMARRLAPLHDKLFYMYALASQATALLFKSETSAARATLGVAAPLIVRYDLGSRYAATAALLAAQEGRWSAAARLLGYGTAAAAAHGVDGEDPAEVRAREQTLQRLAAHLRPDEIEQRQRAGALLSVEDAFRLALADERD